MKYRKGLLTLAGLLLSSTQANAKWREASTEHFLIYSEESKDSLRKFADRLERYDAAMRHFRKIPADEHAGKSTRLTIYIVSNVATVQRLMSGGKAGGNVAGFYLPRATGSIAFVPRTSNLSIDPEIVLRHEYAHHFMFNNYPGAYPAWYTEGFAEFHSTAKFDADGAVGLGTPAHHRAYELNNYERAMPVSKLLHHAGGKLDSAERSALYGRGWLLVHYLTFDPKRQTQMKDYFQRFLAGKGVVEAATAFGDLGELERDLRAYLRRPRMSYYRATADLLPKPEIAIRLLGPGEDAMMDLKMRSRRGVNREQALALLPDMRKAAAPFPSDPSVQATLAEAEYDAGFYKEAEAAADRALAVDGRHVDALIYKGMARMAQARGATDPKTWSEARSWFIKANRADPDDPEPMILTYRSFVQQGVEPSKSVKEGLLYAYGLAPEDLGLRMQVAQLLLMEGNEDAAKIALAPIAQDPHEGVMSDAARKILELLNSGDKDAALKLLRGGRPDEADDADES